MLVLFQRSRRNGYSKMRNCHKCDKPARKRNVTLQCSKCKRHGCPEHMKNSLTYKDSLFCEFCYGLFHDEESLEELLQRVKTALVTDIGGAILSMLMDKK